MLLVTFATRLPYRLSRAREYSPVQVFYYMKLVGNSASFGEDGHCMTLNKNRELEPHMRNALRYPSQKLATECFPNTQPFKYQYAVGLCVVSWVLLRSLVISFRPW